jgi:hypothetical protein
MITPAYIRVLRRVNFKGGGSSGDNYDAAYNARMATIAEAQQRMAEEYFQFWQTDYKPMEQAQIAANLQLIPHETALQKQKLQAEKGLIPKQTALQKQKLQAEKGLIPKQTALQKQKLQAEKGLIPKQTALAGAQMDSALSLLPQQTAFEQAQLADSTQAIGERAPVRAEFYQQATDGVDIDGMVNRASADAMHSFANSQQMLNRNMARMGVNPNSGRFAALSNQNSLNQAKTVAGAKTQARVQGEEQNFNRLTTAMGYGG